jgi:hypothetical protein
MFRVRVKVRVKGYGCELGGLGLGLRLGSKVTGWVRVRTKCKGLRLGLG